MKESAERLKEKCEVKNFKFKRKDDSEKMEKPNCSKGRDKRLGIRKEGGEMDQSRKENDEEQG